MRYSWKRISIFSFSKNMGKITIKNFLIVLKYLVLKTASKRAIQTTAEATGDLISNKISDKITSVSKNSHSEIESTKKRYISLEERQQIIDELRLV